MSRPDSFIETGESLERHKEAILLHWEELVRDVVQNSNRDNSIILKDHIPELIDQLINILKNAEVNELEVGKAHGFHRAILNQYSLADLQTEFSLLRETLIDHLYPMSDVNCSKMVHKYIDILCKHSVIEFINDLKIKQSFNKQVSGDEINDIKNNPVISTH